MAVTYDTAYMDLLEQVPDMLWPQSTKTLALMRTDPQLAAILAAYTLPLRRASWQVDPAGADPAVALYVADNLGLTVAGVEDSAPARGPINWNSTLNVALRYLTFGFQPLEKVLDTTSGQVRLRALAERAAVTITEITVNDDDTLKSVRQTATVAADSRIIPANRMVWLAHDREGIAYQGRSLLRPAYAPWLLKKEMWRVAATSLRRTGMGVPEVTAPLGATPAQIQEAGMLASAVRVGETAGAGLPNGFTLRLRGIEGSVPDPMAFINYLDQQMTRSTLTGMLDLGNTPNGSRALGDSFIDLFMLSLQAIGDEIAATFTEQLVAPLVTAQFGDVPVPTVKVGDVGTRQEVTWEALNGLLGSGALSADPELEAWVRAAFRLPPRPTSPDGAQPSPSGEVTSPIYGYDLDYGIATINERRAQLDLPPIPEGDALAVPASSRVAPLAATDTITPSTPVAAAKATTLRRQLTDVEALSGADFEGMIASFQREEDAAMQDYLNSVEPDLRAEIVAAVAVAVAADALASLADLSPDRTATTAWLTGYMDAAAADGATAVVKEAGKQGVKIKAAAVTVDEIAAAAAVYAANVTGSYARSAATRAAQAWGTTDVPGQVDDHLQTLTQSSARAALGSALATGRASGRSGTFALSASNGVDRTYYASEIMDANTCGTCQSIDGTAYATVEEADAAYPTGGYAGCEGGLRCRGIVIATWN